MPYSVTDQCVRDSIHITSSYLVIELIRYYTKLVQDFVHSLMLSMFVQIPDQDLVERRINQRVNPITNIVYTCDQYRPQIEVEDYEKNKDNEVERREVDEEEESKEADDLFANDVVRLTNWKMGYHIILNT